jgi:hypothetical protein
MGSDIPNEAGVCFHEQRRSFYSRERCHDQHENACHIGYGRCRSGRRWFWSACLWSKPGSGFLDEPEWLFGWEDAEQQALEAARAAVIRLAAGNKAVANYVVFYASDKLKQLNSAKRRQRPAPDTSDTRQVEYLYGHTMGGEETNGCPVRFRITKKTAKRIYYVRQEEEIDKHGEPVDYPWIKSTSDDDDVIGYVNRQKLEADGSVYNKGVHWCRPDWHLYASLEGLLGDRYQHRNDQPDIHQLKAEMAAAHPDRGGTSAAFIEARARYIAARRQARRPREAAS